MEGFKEALFYLEEMEKDLEKIKKYQRNQCKNCEDKIICAGECEKTI